ncbi:hypothetical protein [Streptomyces sp. NPDC056661]|uniref:hypothetical protein n=1 Tax=Streptomyces sp. NPDC056661 TaxID=3345898 RepID=UPI0036A7B2CA
MLPAESRFCGIPKYCHPLRAQERLGSSMTMRSVIAMPRAVDPLPRPEASLAGSFGRLFNRRPRPRYQGVYLHSGGPPSETGPLLYNVVRERTGGVEDAWQQLITGNPAGWSSLTFFCDEKACEAWDGVTKVPMDTHLENFNADRSDPGPVTYQGDPRRNFGFTSPPITESSDKWGADTVWVLCRSELVLFSVQDDGIKTIEVGRYLWAAEPDWYTVDQAFAATYDGD